MIEDDAPGDEKQANLGEVVRTLIAQTGDASRVLECYYWAQEPGVLECIRVLVAVPDQARGALLAYLAAAGNPRSVSAVVDRSGGLTLFSPDAAKIMTSFLGEGLSRPVGSRFHS